MRQGYEASPGAAFGLILVDFGVLDAGTAAEPVRLTAAGVLPSSGGGSGQQATRLHQLQ